MIAYIVNMQNTILKILSENKMSQKDLRKKIEGMMGRKVHPSYLSRIVSGKSNPPYWMIFGIPLIFRKRVDDVWFPNFKDLCGGDK